MIDDVDLLRRYVENQSEEAFAELVQRRIGLVYSVALRRTLDPHSAADAAQAVFVALARKATALARRPALIGWLHRSAQFAANDIVRANYRRQKREQEIHTMQMLAQEGHDPDWDKLRPVLDDVLADINTRDRDLILLRFVDNQPFAAIGSQLRLTENAARMRVERALEKLRVRLARRGLKSTAAVLTVALTSQVGVAAPTGLAATVTSAALAGATSIGSAAVIVSFLKLMGTTKITAIAASAIALAMVGFGVYEYKRAREATMALNVANQERYNLQTHLRSLERPMSPQDRPSVITSRSSQAQNSQSSTVESTASAPNYQAALGPAKEKLAHIGNPHSSNLGEIKGIDTDTAVVLRAWMEENPDAALQWLASLPTQGNQQMHTTEAMIAIETGNDPDFAFQLANSISLDSSRLARIGDVLRVWAPLDPVAATNAVQSADIPEQDKTILITKIAALKTPPQP
jgi:RNA polymerase sigma factor (sigma-70 family)